MADAAFVAAVLRDRPPAGNDGRGAGAGKGIVEAVWTILNFGGEADLAGDGLRDPPASCCCCANARAVLIDIRFVQSRKVEPNGG